MTRLCLNYNTMAKMNFMLLFLLVYNDYFKVHDQPVPLSTVIGVMQQFNCKPIYATPRNMTNWRVIQFERQVFVTTTYTTTNTTTITTTTNMSIIIVILKDTMSVSKEF